MALAASGFESRRFRTAAAYYMAGRPPYADLLIRRVAALIGLAGNHAVLDLGCGPGLLARGLAPLAGTVVAMDPEPEMLRVAAVVCEGIGNVRLVPGGSDDLAPALGRFRLVVMGRSFHWMDRAVTLRRLDALIEPGGAVALFHTRAAAVPENDWTEQFRAIRHRYSAGDAGVPDALHRAGPSHETMLLASPFCCLEAHTVFARHTLDAATLVDRAFSMSSTAPARLGRRAAALRRDIGALIRNIAPDGRLAEIIESSALIARRPGEDPIP